jgi:uncharacterized protein YbjQ (UPF0145 family)
VGDKLFWSFFQLWLQIGLPALLILIGWWFGRMAERRHLRSLDRREGELAHVLVTDLKTFPGGVVAATHAVIVMGEVVIASDYLKRFFAKLRNIFGGQVKSYQLLLERGRREAILRMIQKAHEFGYDAVCNVRLNTATIGRNMIEVTACGTGYLRPECPASA